MNEQDRKIIKQMADYIELGSQGKQQITGRWMSEDQTQCCVIGACMFGAGIVKKANYDLDAKLMKKLGILWYPKVSYPSNTPHWRWIYEPNDVSVIDAIICLNDFAGWRFDQIVSWLRSIAE